MSTSRSLVPACIVGLVGLLSLGACAADPGGRAPASSDAPVGQSLGSLMPAPPSGEVTGQGTVMDAGGEAEFCLGPVAESYPPQCSGVPLEDWTWDGVDGSEIVEGGTSGDVRWGTYAVTGTYDGTSLTVTQPPVPLALYDPMPFEDPSDGSTGGATEARLMAIQSQLPELLGNDGTVYLDSYPERGYLWVDVVWDDGTLQKAADEDFGEGVVFIRSALRSLEG